MKQSISTGIAVIMSAAALTLAGCSASPTSVPTPSTTAAATSAPPTGQAGPTGQTAASDSPLAQATAAAPTSAGVSSQSPSTGAQAGPQLTELPAGFPLPPGANPKKAVSDGKGFYVDITVTNEPQAFAFWKSQLPTAGYPVTDAENHDEDTNGDIFFTGHGCTGGSLDLEDTVATISCGQG